MAAAAAMVIERPGGNVVDDWTASQDQVCAGLDTLIKRINFLSETNNWKDANQQWHIFEIAIFDKNQADLPTCCCGSLSKTRVWTIVNKQKHQLLNIGSDCCVLLLDDVREDFLGVQKVEASLKEIKQNISAFANNELLDVAKRLNVLSDQERTFYEKVKAQLVSPEDQEYLKHLNENLLLTLFFNIEQAALRIKEDPAKNAGPHLVRYARRMEFITEKDETFYLETWKSPKRALTQGQRGYRIALNKQITQKLAQ